MIDNPVINDRPKRMLDVKQAAEKVNLGVSTIWKKTKEGNFPRPYRYPNTKGTFWIEYELEDWLNENLVPA